MMEARVERHASVMRVRTGVWNYAGQFHLNETERDEWMRECPFCGDPPTAEEIEFNRFRRFAHSVGLEPWPQSWWSMIDRVIR